MQRSLRERPSPIPHPFDEHAASQTTVGAALTKLQRRWMITGGTLLGQRRSHSIIPWEIDADIALVRLPRRPAARLRTRCSGTRPTVSGSLALPATVPQDLESSKHAVNDFLAKVRPLLSAAGLVIFGDPDPQGPVSFRVYGEHHGEAHDGNSLDLYTFVCRHAADPAAGRSPPPPARMALSCAHADGARRRGRLASLSRPSLSSASSGSS